jgi:hypothetical protein
MHRLSVLSTEKLALSTEQRRKRVAAVLLLLLLGWNVVRTARFVFTVWPANDEVAFVWQAALTEAARALDEAPPLPTAIGGWTPETMDPPTMAVTLQREDLLLRFFQPPAAVIVPAGDAARILYPAALPLEPELLALLTSWGGTVSATAQVVTVSLPASTPAPAFPLRADFGAELTLLGFDARPAGDGVVVVTYWRALAPAGGPRRVFLHLLDENEEIVAQADAFDVNALSWQTGDLIVQRLTVPAGRSAALAWRLGVYEPVTGRRLPLPAGSDALRLPAPLQ